MSVRLNFDEEKIAVKGAYNQRLDYSAELRKEPAKPINRNKVNGYMISPSPQKQKNYYMSSNQITTKEFTSTKTHVLDAEYDESNYRDIVNPPNLKMRSVSKDHIPNISQPPLKKGTGYGRAVKLDK